MARDGGDGHGGCDTDEDQQRRHQEAAADAEHAGDESDRDPHAEDEEDVDRKIVERKVDLQGVIPPERGLKSRSGIHVSLPLTIRDHAQGDYNGRTPRRAGIVQTPSTAMVNIADDEQMMNGDGPGDAANRLRPTRDAAGQTLERAACFGLAGVRGGAVSQPPAGALTLTASSGCGSATQVWTASFAAISDWRTSLAPTSSRFLTASLSPCRAASVNHL